MNNLKIEYHKNDNLFSATFVKTGMFAYGDTEKIAVGKLKMMMTELIDMSYDLYKRETCGVEQ